MPELTSIDHLVLTVSDTTRTTDFYHDVLGMIPVAFTPLDGTTRYALRFGKQKINLHQLGAEFLPNARNAGVGTADLCFLTDTPISEWMAHLNSLSVSVEEGPVQRTGATGPLLSIYLRDPDGNLIELSNQLG